ncbi:hypothetical protein TRFO_17095 [Tritrichomonas foetus]|uniref:DUF3447 domain-containing protein n=1 Tax=Tritrichomonas foetus TaxID=1144522 RepID=A0A1J4KNF8_9EUKA|nr:hypothetical protein TRFO_17095 [Tritrichomonas foetus]|eukprot:OHT12849.1 hypothetical protein TRFO_17095 [Tritrichomonas foetus]
MNISILKTLQNLQSLLIDIVNNADFELEEKMEKLFCYFNEIEIENNMMIYDRFIGLLSHISIVRSSSTKNIFHIITKILNQLIWKHSLKNLFTSSRLLFYFSENNPILLYLYENNVIELSSIKTRLEKYPSFNMHHFFFPEMVSNFITDYFMKSICSIGEKSHRFHENTNSYDELVKFTQNNEVKTFISYIVTNARKIESDLNSTIQRSFQNETSYEIRTNCHSDDELARIIQKDDITSFISYTIKKAYQLEFGLNSNIKSSYLEINPDINRCPTGISLLEYSMAFGAINIFKYLWLNRVEYSQLSMRYSIIGGNSEIIQILLNESRYKYTKDEYIISIKYHQQDIKQFLENHLDNLIKEGQDLHSLIKYFNYEFIIDQFEIILTNGTICL